MAAFGLSNIPIGFGELTVRTITHYLCSVINRGARRVEGREVCASKCANFEFVAPWLQGLGDDCFSNVADYGVGQEYSVTVDILRRAFDGATGNCDVNCSKFVRNRFR